MDDLHKNFWADEKRTRRRSPFNPVVEAFVWPKIDFLIKNAPDALGKTILDVGCGNGFFTCHLAKHFDVTGLDFSAAMLKMNPHKKVVLGSVYDIPFADESFDVVFCSDLLHHLDDPKKALSEMKRVSKKYVAVSEPNRNNPLMFVFSALFSEERGALKFSKKYLLDLFAGQKLQLLDIMVAGMIFPNKTPEAVLPVFKKFDFNFPFGGYITAIAKNHEDSPG